jgi:hypothetical protein
MSMSSRDLGREYPKAMFLATMVDLAGQDPSERPTLRFVNAFKICLRIR